MEQSNRDIEPIQKTKHEEPKPLDDSSIDHWKIDKFDPSPDKPSGKRGKGNGSMSEKKWKERQKKQTEKQGCSPSTAYPLPFTDLQKVQLHAQIFVFGSSIRGTAPDEAFMVSAFGLSGRERGVWEPVWLAVKERARIKQSQSTGDVDTDLVPEATGKQVTPQSKVFQTPVNLAGIEANPTTILSPIIPLPSPLWSISTPYHDAPSPHLDVGTAAAAISHWEVFWSQLAKQDPGTTQEAQVKIAAASEAAAAAACVAKAAAEAALQAKLLADEASNAALQAKLLADEASNAALQAKLLADEALGFVHYTRLLSKEGRDTLKELVAVEGEGSKAPRTHPVLPIVASHCQGNKKRRRSAKGNYTESDMPLEKRPRLQSSTSLKGMDQSLVEVEPVAGKPEESKLLALSASEKVFNVGTSTKAETKPEAKRKNRKTNETKDPVRFAKHLEPQGAASRGRRNQPRVDSKEKQTLKVPTTKSPSALSRAVPHEAPTHPGIQPTHRPSVSHDKSQGLKNRGTSTSTRGFWL